MGDETTKQEYKSFANNLTKIKTAAKKEYNAKLKLNKSNPQKTWEILRTLLPGKYSNSATLPTSLDINGNSN